jgi:hypothetical protein
MVGADLLERLR